MYKFKKRPNVKNIITPYFKVSYPNLFQPKKNDLNGKIEYSVTALFPKGEDLSAIEKEIQAAIEFEWGTNKELWPPKLKSPVRDQAEKLKIIDGKKVMPAGHEPGAMFMTLKTKDKPGIVDKDNKPLTDPSKIYPGCWARASIRVSLYNQGGNAGVTFYLQNFQFYKDGDPLTGRAQAETEFSPVDISVEASPNATGLFS